MSWRAAAPYPWFTEPTQHWRRRLVGRPLGAAPDSLFPAPRQLSPEQIDTLIAYLQARVVGRGRITRQDCLFYFYDSSDDLCEDYK